MLAKNKVGARLGPSVGGPFVGPDPPLHVVSHASRLKHLSIGSPSSSAARAGTLALKLHAQRRVKVTVQVTKGGGSALSSQGGQQDKDGIRGALKDALTKIELLNGQVALVGELQEHMAQQNALINKLQDELVTGRANMDLLAASAARVAELERALSSLERKQVERASEEQERYESMQQKLVIQRGITVQQVQSLNKQLEDKGSQLAAMTARALEAEQQQGELRKQAEKAAQEAADRQAKLAQEQAAIEAEMKKVSSSKGFGSRGRKKGQAANSSNDSLQLQLQALSLRQSLEQSQAELEELRVNLAKREEEADTANKSLERLAANFKEQAIKLFSVTAEASQLQQQLEEITRKQQALGAPDAAAKEDLEQVRSQLAASQRAEEASQAEVHKYQQQAEDLQAQVARLTEEGAALGAATAEAILAADSLRAALGEKQDDDIVSLEERLMTMSIDMDEALGLRSDLQVLADAFQEKEKEVVKLQAAVLAAAEKKQASDEQLQQALRRESEARNALDAAQARSVEVQEALAAAQQTNRNLVQQKQEVEGLVRAQADSAQAVDVKVLEMERSLTEFAQQIMALKGQLGHKTHALVEAGEKLRVTEVTLVAAQSQAAALAVEVEEQRKSSLLKAGEILILTRELQALKAEVQQAHASHSAAASEVVRLTGSEAELQAAKGALEEAVEERQQLRGQLQRSKAEVQALQAEVQLEVEGRKTELSQAVLSLSAKSRELEELKRKVSLTGQQPAEGERQAVQALALAQEQVDKLQAALSAREADLQDAMHQRDKLQGDVSALALQVNYLTLELESSRLDATVGGQVAGAASSQASVAEVQLAELKAELAKEVQKTQELLAQAEELVLQSVKGEAAATKLDSSATEAELRAVSARAEQSAARVQELEAEMSTLQAEVQRLHALASKIRAESEKGVAAESKAAALQAEVAALRVRAQQLEALGQERSEMDAELLKMAQEGDVKDLTEKVEALQAENHALKQSNAHQQQMLKQTRSFLQGKTVC